MKTLSKQHTKGFFFTDSGREELRKSWSARLKTDKDLNDPGMHLLYVTILGRDIRKGFTATSNSCKIKNGTYVDFGFRKALKSATSIETLAKFHDKFGGCLRPGTLTSLVYDVLNVPNIIFPGKKCNPPNLLDLDPFKGDKVEKPESVLSSKA